MPWIRANLRGQQVFARANEAGALHAVSGKVEIRYKPNDGRMYSARESNLTVVDPTPLPDETCGPAEAAPPQKQKSAESETKVVAAKRPVAIPKDSAIAYADGACSGNPGPAGSGVILFDGKHRIEISEYLGVGTNNIAELTAVLRAMEAVPDPERALLIYTDSQYTIGVVQKGWKAKANAELVAAVKKALSQRSKTRLFYVPGHAGVSLNERADELARIAVRDRASSRSISEDSTLPAHPEL